MATSKRMTEDDIVSAVSQQIDDASAYEAEGRSKHRELALEFMDGKVDIPPMGEKRSKVVSRDVADTHGLIMPGIMRIFFGSEQVVRYDPTRPEHDAYADQATSYVNYVVRNECEGYKQFRNAFSEALLLGNGLMKHWWDDTPQYDTEDYSGLSFEIKQATINDPDVEEVLEEEEYDDPDYQAPDAEQILQLAAANGLDVEGVTEEQVQSLLPPVPKLYRVKLKKLRSTGRLRVMSIPDEEFRMTRSATAIDEDLVFCEHVQRKTRSDLIKEGYPEDKVNEIPLAGDEDRDSTRHARDEEYDEYGKSPDTSTEAVDIHECYVLLDTDGDGIAERRRVVMAGDTGKRIMLADEEWGDDLPFSDIVPDPVPHRWRGRGIYEEMGDIQRIKTVMLRGTLDNLYENLAPQRWVEHGSVANPDELTNPTFGGLIWLNSGKTPPTPIEKEYLAPKILPVMEYMDQVGEKRTGVSMRSQSMDMDALQNQSATAVNAAQSAAHSKIEEYALNIAECGGMRRIFSCILRLITKHQDRAKSIKISGEWTDIDPRPWSADMRVTINTGLGTGSRERDLALVSAVAQKQEQVIATLGAFNPIADLGMLAASYQKMAEFGGARTPEQFFKVPDADALALMEKESKAQGQQPDPELVKAQMQAQIAQNKTAADIQMDREKQAAKMQADALDREAKRQADAEERAWNLQASREEAALRAETARQEAAARIQVMREEAQRRAELARQEADWKHEERMFEMDREFQLQAQRNAANVNPDSNIPQAQ